MKDIFICHATEDKDDIVRPLFEAFLKSEITCWYDEAEIGLGDSIVQKVNEGLKISKYVLVVLSKNFLQKKWAQFELNKAINIEASIGETKILPLLVGTKQEKNEILTQIPLLSDKRYISWEQDVNVIVNAILSRLGKEKPINKHRNLPPSENDILNLVSIIELGMENIKQSVDSYMIKLLPQMQNMITKWIREYPLEFFWSYDGLSGSMDGPISPSEGPNPDPDLECINLYEFVMENFLSEIDNCFIQNMQQISEEKFKIICYEFKMRFGSELFSIHPELDHFPLDYMPSALIKDDLAVIPKNHRVSFSEVIRRLFTSSTSNGIASRIRQEVMRDYQDYLSTSYGNLKKAFEKASIWKMEILMEIINKRI